MIGAAQAISLLAIVFGVLGVVIGMLAYNQGGAFLLFASAGGIVSGVIISCLAAIVENTARSAAAQERLVEKLGK